jgi:hypothetical protein
MNEREINYGSFSFGLVLNIDYILCLKFSYFVAIFFKKNYCKSLKGMDSEVGSRINTISKIVRNEK